ncbi:MAG: hypothetical protein A2Y12_17180 [Planctomycetes bacterium GWF2_42_9]|nr:MAG: hypothetical protein A2Y12_17180 [Planctomycetes bacterium GWF2_42_9]
MKNINWFRTLIVTILFLFSSFSASFAINRITIQDGLTVGSDTYSGTESAWISKANPDTNYGLNAICRVGYQNGGTDVYRTLIRFNQLSMVHDVNLGISTEGIISAKLILTTDSSFEGTGICELRVLGLTDEDWTQMYSTWNTKRTDIVPVEPWSSGAGIGTNLGGVVYSANWASGGPTNTQMEFQLTGEALNAVKEWVSGSNTGKTIVLKAASESGSGNNYLDFYSEQNAVNAEYKPKLVINYVPVRTIDIQEGLTINDKEYGLGGGTESAWMSSLNPNTRYGLNGICRVGNQYDSYWEINNAFRTIIRFNELSPWVGVESYDDLGFPVGAMLNAKLIMTTDASFEGAGICELRVINQNDLDWTEMYTSWNWKRTDYVPMLAWAGGPGLGTNYGDIIDTFAWNTGAGDINTPRYVPGDPNSAYRVEFDLSADSAMQTVKDWITGDNTSGTFMLKAEVEEGTGMDYLDFFSEDAPPEVYPAIVKPLFRISYIPTAKIEIQNGLTVAGEIYDGTESVWLDSGVPNTNLGLNGIMRVGYQYPLGSYMTQYRSLIRFGQLSHWANVDLGIDTNDIIAARIILTLDSSYVGKANCELRIMNTSDEDWTEMYCTWNKKRSAYPTLPDIDWVGAAGAENSYGPVQDSKYCKTAHADTQKIFDLEGDALEVVRAWVTGSNTDAAFLLKSDVETGDSNTYNYIDFYSEQTSTGDYLKPKLEIFYVSDSISTCDDARLAGLMLKADINEDCVVDLQDLSAIVERWIWCNNPQDPDCQK